MSNSASPLHPGDPFSLGDYRMRGRLGRGGMGTVYLAHDPSGRPVALKVIHPDLAEDEGFRRRFAREADAARRVARFSTAGVIDAELENAPLYVVSEYISGPNLSQAVREHGPMIGGTLESVALGVAAALSAIHQAGIVHRDLKPANVLLSPVGPKVIDFGIAGALEGSGDGLTRSSQLLGTPSYMAPELIAGQRATPAADVFAWGCLVAFAGTGKAPFDAPTVPAVLHNISSGEPSLDGLDPGLLELVRPSLDKDPRNRPTSQQLLDRLVGHRQPAGTEVQRTISAVWTPAMHRPPQHVPETATSQAVHPPPPPSPPGQTPRAQPSRPGGRRRTLLVSGAAAVALLLAGALGFVLLGGDREPPQDITSLYGSDFATDPDWGDNTYDEDEAPYASGYVPGEGLMLAYDPSETSDPWTGATWTAPLVGDGDLPDRLLLSTDVRVVEGYEYLTFGLRCVNSYYPSGTDLDEEEIDPDHAVDYTAHLRADGAEATLSKWATDLDETEELAAGDVPEFHPYSAVTGEESERGEELTNDIKLACEFHSDDDGVPTAEISLWVNDRLVTTAEDPEPVPEEYVDGTLVRGQRILYDRGQSNEPLRILYEAYHLHEIRD